MLCFLNYKDQLFLDVGNHRTNLFLKKSLKLGTWYLLSFYKQVINALVNEMNDIVVAV